jgi:glycosyltransferase involved in cell wall biosynthesis
MPHDGNTMKTKSLGGSETAGIQLAEVLAKLRDAFGRKNRVLIFSSCPSQTVVNDVLYMPLQAAATYIRGADIDILIVSRYIDFLAHPHNAKVCFLWCHDLALKRTEANIRGVLYQVDRILLMSQFQKKQYSEVYGIPEPAMEVIRNGIDLSLFPESRKLEDRQKGIMLYSARPERGLENLVRPGGIMDKLLEKAPDVNLLVAHYDNTTDQMRPYYEMLWRRISEMKNVQMLGSLTKEKLYDVYSRAWLYCYPTPAPISPDFDEISCISAMEAQACGLPFLTTSRGALVETVAPGTGIIVPGNGLEERVQDAFVAEIQSLMQDDERWNGFSKAGYLNSKYLGWEPVAQRILNLSHSVLSKRTEDPVRVYKHFLLMSDIAMCRYMEKEQQDNERFMSLTEKEREFVKEGWYFTESPDKFREHYLKVDAGATVEHYEKSEEEPRWIVLRDFLRRTGKKFNRVLDYGCTRWGSIPLTSRGSKGCSISFYSMKSSSTFFLLTI